MWAYWVVVFRRWRRWESERHGTLEMAEVVAEQLTPDDGYHAGSVSADVQHRRQGWRLMQLPKGWGLWIITSP